MNTRKKMVSSATDKQKCSENHLIIVIIIDFFSLFINEPPFQYTLKERRSFVFIWKKKNFVYLFTPRHLKNKNWVDFLCNFFCWPLLSVSCVVAKASVVWWCIIKMWIWLSDHFWFDNCGWLNVAANNWCNCFDGCPFNRTVHEISTNTLILNNCRIVHRWYDCHCRRQHCNETQ